MLNEGCEILAVAKPLENFGEHQITDASGPHYQTSVQASESLDFSLLLQSDLSVL